MPVAIPLRAPEPGAIFQRHRGRLALFKPEQRVNGYWRDYWKPPGKNEHTSEGAAAGRLGEYEQTFLSHLKSGGRVLEAGCGPGQIVRALRQRGFDAVGVEFEADVVAWVRANVPGLDVRQGDVRALDLPDRSLDGYVSLGVVEHFDEGPEAVLREARRVLASDGRAFVSVPYLNTPRRAERDRLHEVEPPDGTRFYQYYFDVADFTACAERAGLRVLQTAPLFVETHWTRDHALFSRYWNARFHATRFRSFERRLMARLAYSSEALRRRYAHMMLFVCALS